VLDFIAKLQQQLADFAPAPCYRRSPEGKDTGEVRKKGLQRFVVGALS
jgi:hypothetical protein